MVPRSPISARCWFPSAILPHNDFLYCHVLLLLHTLHYPLLITGTVCVCSSWLLRHIQLFLHRSDVVINSYRLTNQIFIIVASPFANWCLSLSFHTIRPDTSTSKMTIDDDTYNRQQIRRIVTSYRQTPLQYYSTIPPQRLLCKCIVYCCVYECLRTSLLLLLHKGLVDRCTTFKTTHI